MKICKIVARDVGMLPVKFNEFGDRFDALPLKSFYGVTTGKFDVACD